jgi:hypothetical protein
MIFINKENPGRLGNRLFAYNFLRQLAQQTGLTYYHPDLKDQKYFEEMNKTSSAPKILNKKFKLTPALIASQAPSDLLKLIADLDAQNKNIKLLPPILGDTFFDYCFTNPNNFIKIKSIYSQSNIPQGKEVLNIGLHFRGGDFFSWDLQAVLKSDYYIEALKFCLATYPTQKIYLHIFTDDEEFEAYIKTREFIETLPVAGIIPGNYWAEPIYDLYQMSQCDILISSPSTFSIWGGILGQPKKIIHSQNWLDYITAKNDKFWCQLLAGGNEYYNLWKTF